ncbi:HDIG domain protein [hydrothermal vent metagenome]|uniref:HDIG domain protein n=1 Tax=hydrothermal vent metagenome TaxID=652676 RepID=A0A3B0Z565_9ZZZZ
MKVVVEAHNVKKGMYVSELDRPWLNSPFLFQGFRITNTDEIEQIADLCEYVFVDTEKSTVPVEREPSLTLPPSPEAEKQNVARLIKRALPYTEKFEDEFANAKGYYQSAKEEIGNLFDDIKMGKSLEIKDARTTVTLMADSILRHPDALLLLASLGNKDKNLVTHALSVCTLSLVFARSLGFETAALVDLGLGALLHDIGEIKISDQLSGIAANVSEEEQALFEGHTVIGAMILKKLGNLPDNVIAIVRDHHERIDGSGYPDKLAGAAISVHTRIVSIVDTYDSILNGTNGYESMSVDDVLKSLYAWRHDLFDELLVEKFIQCVGIYPLGSVVELRTGQIGIVVSSRPDARLLPRIMLILDVHREPVEPPQMINLAMFKEKLDTDDFEIKRLVDGQRYNIDVRQYILREFPST